MIPRPPRSTLFPTRRSSDLPQSDDLFNTIKDMLDRCDPVDFASLSAPSKSAIAHFYGDLVNDPKPKSRSEEHTSELQSQSNLVCRLLLEKKKTAITTLQRAH